MRAIGRAQIGFLRAGCRCLSGVARNHASIPAIPAIPAIGSICRCFVVCRPPRSPFSSRALPLRRAPRPRRLPRAARKRRSRPFTRSRAKVTAGRIGPAMCRRQPAIGAPSAPLQRAVLWGRTAPARHKRSSPCRSQAGTSPKRPSSSAFLKPVRTSTISVCPGRSLRHLDLHAVLRPASVERTERVGPPIGVRAEVIAQPLNEIGGTALTAVAVIVRQCG
jgi:hypothetical protein